MKYFIIILSRGYGYGGFFKNSLNLRESDLLEKVREARRNREISYELYGRRLSIRNRIIAICVMLAISALMYLGFSVMSGENVEKFYSNGFYKLYARLIMMLTKPFPISIAEVALGTILLIIPVSILGLIRKLMNVQVDRARIVILFFLNWLCVGAVFLTMFVVGMAPNYMRQPLPQAIGLSIEKPATKDIVELTQYIADRANKLAKKLDAEQAKPQPLTVEELQKYSVAAYSLLEQARPELATKVSMAQYTVPKPVKFSDVMSDFGVLGAVTPFTMEANVNTHITGYNVPVSMMFELAHICGFMREEEALWLAIEAGRASDQLYMQYSSEISALRHCLGVLVDTDKDAATAIYNGLEERIRSDYAASDDYFAQRKGKKMDIGNNVSDVYLKLNKQTNGIKSSDMVVDILLADYKLQKQAGADSK